ncbi:MAG: hypothetical protein R3E32_28270 [Chitinophagales bacterium]
MFRALVCVATLPDLYSLVSYRFALLFDKDISMSLVSFRNSSSFTIRQYRPLQSCLLPVHPSRETTLQLANSSSRHTRL